MTSKKSGHRKNKNFVMKSSWRGHFSLRRATWSKVQLALLSVLFGLGGIKIGHDTRRVTFVGFLSQTFPCLSPKHSSLKQILFAAL